MLFLDTVWACNSSAQSGSSCHRDLSSFWDYHMAASTTVYWLDRAQTARDIVDDVCYRVGKTHLDCPS